MQEEYRPRCILSVVCPVWGEGGTRVLSRGVPECWVGYPLPRQESGYSLSPVDRQTDACQSTASMSYYVNNRLSCNGGESHTNMWNFSEHLLSQDVMDQTYFVYWMTCTPPRPSFGPSPCGLGLGFTYLLLLGCGGRGASWPRPGILRLKMQLLMAVVFTIHILRDRVTACSHWLSDFLFNSYI